MRRALALLFSALALAASLVACGGTSSRLWVTHPPVFTACGSPDCGPNALTLNWGAIQFTGRTGYFVYLNGVQVADVVPSKYTFYGLDCGTTFTFGVRAHNGSGGTSGLISTSYTSPACTGSSAPTNVTLPIISGTTTQGQTLSTTNGTWTGSPTSFAYQWQRCSITCSNIAGATSSSYLLALADVGDTIQVTVTAANVTGSTPATSARTGTIAGSGAFGCAFTHAAGFNGTGGTGSCWDTHTGVQNGTGFTEAQIVASPAGTGFTQINSDVSVSSGGSCSPANLCTGNPAVIDHKYIVGCVAINSGANNVTVKNTLIVSNGDACTGSSGGTAGDAFSTGRDPGAPTGLLVQDTTVDGGTGNGGPGAGEQDYGVNIAHGECLRCNILHVDQGALGYGTAASPSQWVNTYIHDPMPQQSWETISNCGHRNGWFIFGASYNIVDHSYVMMTGPLSPSWGCVTAALSLQGDFVNDHITFSSDYTEGDSSADIALGQCADAAIVIQNNIESTFNGKADYGGEGGPNVHPGVTWTANTSEGGGATPNPTGCP